MLNNDVLDNVTDYTNEVRVASTKSDRSTKKATSTASKKAAPKAKAKPNGKASPKSNGASAKPIFSGSAKPGKAERNKADRKNGQPEKGRAPVVDAKSNGEAKSNGKAKEKLITLGKSKGFLTYDDVHDALPGEDIGAEQMDDVLSALDSEDIEVVDDVANLKISSRGLPEQDAPAKSASASKAEDGSEPPPSTPAPINIACE